LLSHHIAPGLYGSGAGHTPFIVESTITTLLSNPTTLLPNLIVTSDSPNVELSSNGDLGSEGIVYTSYMMGYGNGIVYPFGGILSPL